MRFMLPSLFAAALASACGGNVTVDEVPGSGGAPASSSSIASVASVASVASGAGGGSAEACITACAAQYPSGAETFEFASGGCICQGCSEACTQAVCMANALPSDACLPCVQTALAGDTCQNHEGLFDICTKPSNNDCYAFTSCFQACGS